MLRRLPKLFKKRKKVGICKRIVRKGRVEAFVRTVLPLAFFIPTVEDWALALLLELVLVVAVFILLRFLFRPYFKTLRNQTANRIGIIGIRLRLFKKFLKLFAIGFIIILAILAVAAVLGLETVYSWVIPLTVLYAIAILEAVYHRSFWKRLLKKQEEEHAWWYEPPPYP